MSDTNGRDLVQQRLDLIERRLKQWADFARSSPGPTGADDPHPSDRWERETRGPSPWSRLSPAAG
jgi:hypothetical protein